MTTHLFFNISKLTSGVFYDIIPDRAHLELELRSFKDSEIGKAHSGYQGNYRRFIKRRKYKYQV